MCKQKELRDLVDKSYERCRFTGTFPDDFYGHFLPSSEKVAEKFALTNMEAQKKLLDHGIRHLILFYHEPSSITATKMVELGESHARSGMNIEPELYAFFLDSLLKAVAENDPQFNDELDVAWREVASHGIAVMTAMWDD